MKISPFFCFFMALMLFLQQPVAALNWQGTGDLNNDNLTVIWNYIYANLDDQIDNKNIDGFCEGLSITLNDQWAPAWNVVITVTFAL